MSGIHKIKTRKTKTNRKARSMPSQSTAIRYQSATYWARTERAHVLNLFHRAAHEVPAYKHFLSKHGIDPHRIRSLEDLLQVPSTAKNNYLREYAFSDLFWNGTVATNHTLTATSGSTGEPFYFARTARVNEQSSYIHELFLNTSSLDPKKPTLVIVCFGMGLWIGGTITYRAFEIMSQRGYPLGIITPGINKREIIRALRNLAPSYKQVILAGYPPFIKDIIDETVDSGVTLSRLKIAIVFAAEAFSEEFRTYVASAAGIKNPHTDTMNIYGSADLGTMAFETPLSILVRQMALSYPALFNDLFGPTQKTPTMGQYVPHFVTFQAVDGNLFVTGDSAIPLIRYSIGDHGGVLSFEEVIRRCSRHDVDILQVARDRGIQQHTRELPFVYVYERSDLSATLYGLQIYPEQIRSILYDERCKQCTTGRMVLVTRFDENQDQYLEVNIEMKNGQSSDGELVQHIESQIDAALREKNAEYRELASHLGERARPRVILCQHEDPHYFRRDIKQRWVIRD